MQVSFGDINRSLPSCIQISGLYCILDKLESLKPSRLKMWYCLKIFLNPCLSPGIGSRYNLTQIHDHWGNRNKWLKLFTYIAYCCGNYWITIYRHVMFTCCKLYLVSMYRQTLTIRTSCWWGRKSNRCLCCIAHFIGTPINRPGKSEIGTNETNTQLNRKHIQDKYKKMI